MSTKASPTPFESGDDVPKYGKPATKRQSDSGISEGVPSRSNSPEECEASPRTKQDYVSEHSRVVEASDDSVSSNDFSISGNSPVVEARDDSDSSEDDVPLVSLKGLKIKSTPISTVISDSENSYESEAGQTYEDEDKGERNVSGIILTDSSEEDSPKPQSSKIQEVEKNVQEVIDLVDTDSDDDTVSPYFAQPISESVATAKYVSQEYTAKYGSQEYTSEDLREIELKIQKLTSVIKRNEYDAQTAMLPEVGARLRQVIQEDRRKLVQLRELLVKARNQQSKNADSKAWPIFKNNAAPIRNEPAGGESLSQNAGTIAAQLSAARQRVANFRRAATTASKMADGGRQLMMKLGEAEKEVLRKEEQLKKVSMQSAASLTNQAWQAQRMDMAGFGMSAEERSRMLQDFGANNLYGGRMNKSKKQEVRSVTMEAIKAMHTSLETMPAEGNEEDQPLCLRSTINLFPHQKQALAWLLWRETQHPAGGILADDMGLGKTLTMISLVLKHREDENLREKARRERGDEVKEDKKSGHNLVISKTTLVICPASLVGQWENEVNNKCKSGMVRVLVYHGAKRKCSAKELARYDIVITTYGTVQSEVKSVLGEKAEKDAKKKMDDMVAAEDMTEAKGLSELLGVAWERIVLDEAHIIRNPKSLTSQAVCRLRAERRWCLTGTPIQNKEMDLYALVRFLRCSPFDEYRHWKVWIDNKGPQGQARMNTLVRSLLLRRTKETKSQVTGQCIVDLPEKSKIEHKIKLTPEERKVYLEVFSFSQAALRKYMDQNEERQEMREQGFSGADRDYEKSKKEDPRNQHQGSGGEMGSQPENVKAHHILVLLLRLRQICSHPGLIKSMLDTETKATEGLQDEDGEELDLISAMEDMRVEDGKESPDQKILDLANPVFSNKRTSSKIDTVVEELLELKRKGAKTGIIEKTVIVSQWTSMLLIVKVHIEAMGMMCTEINGQIAVKLRGNIVNEFNDNPKGPQVMLLSLAAGGVGLNLVGANHLFLLDMHWNPQLERQACDRVYRVGQKKEVKIHRFVVEDSVEEKILLLQEKKLNLADDVLTGAKRSGANKLSMNDLQMLFQMN